MNTLRASRSSHVHLRAGMSLIWVALLCMVIMYLFAIVAFMFLRRLMWPVKDAYAYCTYGYSHTTVFYSPTRTLTTPSAQVRTVNRVQI